MYTISSEDELLKAFRPHEREQVILPPTVRFPLNFDPYLTWLEPSGVRVYLVFRSPKTGSFIGVAFRKDQQGTSPSPAGMCDWCLSTGPSDQIGLLTATVDTRRRVGVSLCLDLSCALKLESISQTYGLKLETLSGRVQDKMAQFCSHALQLR